MKSLENEINPYLYSLAVGILSEKYPQDLLENAEVACNMIFNSYNEMKSMNPELDSIYLTKLSYQGMISVLNQEILYKKSN